MMKEMMSLLREERGSQITEFGIYAALVVAAAVVLVSQLGTKVVDAYQSIVTALTPAA